MKWTTKAAIQRLLNNAPMGPTAYYLGQRTFGNFRRFSVTSKVRQAVCCLSYLNGLGEDIEGWHAMEIGTGWTPIIPLVFWLNGLRTCDTYDVAPLMKRKLFFETIRQLSEDPRAVVPQPASAAKRASVADKLRRLVNAAAFAPSVAHVLHECGIRYHAKRDAADTALPSNSVDLVFSNVVLEHVPLASVHRLFAEAYRVLRPNGYMVHLIDPSDHFSHGDASISPVNFLRFSEREFARYNTSFLFQNRIRASAWRTLITDHSFSIRVWDCVVNEKALQLLPSLPVDKAFAGLPPEDLCTTAIWVVATRPP